MLPATARSIRLLALAILLGAGAAPAQPRRGRPAFAGFDGYATATMRTWQVPGMAVAVVRGDSIVLAKGLGVRTLGTADSVGVRTLFAIGSATKAMTGAALAMLADDGLIRFDRRVTDYLPGFQLADPWVTREFTVADLLLHRSGVTRGDALFYGTTRSRSELVAALRDLPMTTSFRSRFEYHNLMYIAAGEVIAAVTGGSYDDFIRRRILDPLGMRDATLSVRDLVGRPDVATPHAVVGGAVRPVPWRNIDAAAASGGLNANVIDMAAWLRFWINRGQVDGRRLLSEAMVAEASGPRVLVDDPTFVARLMAEEYLGYGYGWFVTTHRGRRWVTHGGHIDGMAALVSFLPAERLGVVILTNMNQVDIGVPLTRYLFDLALGLPPRDYSAEYRAAELAFEAQARPSAGPSRATGTRPSLPNEAYVGTYRNPIFGAIVIGSGPTGGLTVQLDRGPTIRGPLEHWHFDTFVARLDDVIFGTQPITFQIGADGRPRSLKFSLVGDGEWIKQ
ncbi:MAG: serine hydrolase [Gemmatimonadales bacterium]|nr:serine hydrolase [Gemmatimonadales bacterium]